MKVSFDQSFQKSISKLKNKQVAQRIIKLIDQLEKAEKLTEISNVKKLKGFQNYYRIRIGDYRLVLEQVEKEWILLIFIAHRKDIYDRLP